MRSQPLTTIPDMRRDSASIPEKAESSDARPHCDNACSGHGGRQSFFVILLLLALQDTEYAALAALYGVSFGAAAKLVSREPVFEAPIFDEEVDTNPIVDGRASHVMQHRAPVLILGVESVRRTHCE